MKTVACRHFCPATARAVPRHRAGRVLAQSHDDRARRARDAWVPIWSFHELTPPPPVGTASTGRPIRFSWRCSCSPPACAALGLWLAPNGAGLTVVTGDRRAGLLRRLGLLLFAFGLLQFPTRAVAVRHRQGDRRLRAPTASWSPTADRASSTPTPPIALSPAATGSELRPVERLFAGSPDVSESVYRLSQAAKSGKSRGRGTAPRPAADRRGAVAWYRIRVRPLEGVARRGQRRCGRSPTTRASTTATRTSSRTSSTRSTISTTLRPASFSAEPRRRDRPHERDARRLARLRPRAVRLGQLKDRRHRRRRRRRHADDDVRRPGEVKTNSSTSISSRARAASCRRASCTASPSPATARPALRARWSSTARPGEVKGEDSARRRGALRPLLQLDADGDRLGRRRRRASAPQRRLRPARPGGAEGRRRRGKPSIFGLVAERDHAGLAKALAAAPRAGARSRRSTSRSTARSRRARRVSSSRPPIRASDEGASAIVFALDTTEQRTLQENLAQSQKMQAIGQLAGGVAHDFNNVLTAIIGYSDLLLANHRPTDPSFQDIMQIKQNANRAAGLVRQLLAFSRRQTLRPQTLQLSDVLSELQMLLRRLVGETIELDVVHGRDLWLVKADLNQFEQVIVNLVVNARDAMPDGGKITLRTRNVPAAECGAFKDMAIVPGRLCAGRGRGHRPRHSGRRAGQDFRAVLHHQGSRQGHRPRPVDGLWHRQADRRLRVLRQRAGRRRDLPHPPAPPRRAEGRGAGQEGSRQAAAADLTGRGAILLVEDEEAVRAFAARALASRGYTVLEAESGVEALQRRRGGRRADRPHRLRRHHAGNGRPDHVRRIAPPRRRRRRSSSSPATPTTPSPATCRQSRSSSSCPSPSRSSS